MSIFSDGVKAIKGIVLLRQDIEQLKESARSQSERLTRVTEIVGDLRDRVSRLEGVIEGAAMATRQRRIEE